MQPIRYKKNISKWREVEDWGMWCDGVAKIRLSDKFRLVCDAQVHDHKGLWTSCFYQHLPVFINIYQNSKHVTISLFLNWNTNTCAISTNPFMRNITLYIKLSMPMQFHVYGTRRTMYMHVWSKQMQILYLKNFYFFFVSCGL